MHAGLMLRYKHSNIILTGGVDDIWQDTLSEELIIVDISSKISLFTNIDPNKACSASILDGCLLSEFKIDFVFCIYT